MPLLFKGVTHMQGLQEGQHQHADTPGWNRQRGILVPQQEHTAHDTQGLGARHDIPGILQLKGQLGR